MNNEPMHQRNTFLPEPGGANLATPFFGSGPESDGGPFEPEPGVELGQGFVVERHLGRGERSTVMLVRKDSTGESAVFKVIDGGAWGFESGREGPMAVPEADFEHGAGVVTVFDRRVVRRHGRRLICELREWAEGGSLPQYLARRDAPTTRRRDEALSYGRDLARGLTNLQKAGYALHDLKWSDLLLVGDQLKVDIPAAAVVGDTGRGARKDLLQKVGTILHVLFHASGALPQPRHHDNRQLQVAPELYDQLPRRETRLLERCLDPSDEAYLVSVDRLASELATLWRTRQSEPDPQTLKFCRLAAEAYLYGQNYKAHQWLDEAKRGGCDHPLLSTLHEMLQARYQQVQFMLENSRGASLKHRVQTIREAADLYPDHPELVEAIEQVNQTMGQIEDDLRDSYWLWSSQRIPQLLTCLQCAQQRAPGDALLQRTVQHVQEQLDRA